MWLERVPRGADLWDWLRGFAGEQDVRTGTVSMIGAVERAVVSFYNQKTHAYHDLRIEGPHEIVSCSGNISIHEGAPFPHVHIVLSAEDGRCVGGHLKPGTIAFAAEARIEELEGGERVRAADQATGLPLWRE